MLMLMMLMLMMLEEHLAMDACIAMK